MPHDDADYFDRIDDQLDSAFTLAEQARSQGKDPQAAVEIPLAEDMAARVENILDIPGVASRVRDLDGEMEREEAALELARDFAEGRVGEYDTRAGKIEGAVRTAVALLTEGVVAAPIEGIDRVEISENDDGTEFVRVYYAGPIRSAGGTAQALSVLVADYTRSLLGIDRYKPRDAEIERYAEEVALYDEETGLQYTPKATETKFIAEHCPVMLDGEATGSEDVSGYRNLERVATNMARGGMCLVLAEGIALKAPKIKRYTGRLDEVEWPWLDNLTTGGLNADAEPEPGSAETSAEADGDGRDAEETQGQPRVEPSNKYLRDLIAGRPVFAHPSEQGGFRLRYGRARNHGFATAGVHPATMRLVDDFLATGTQLKTERPGKAAGVVPVDSIEGPTVKLSNGEVRRIDDPADALEIRNGVEEILDLGEYLVNYGEFVENNHRLAPASYVVEWWSEELAAAGGAPQALRDDPAVDLADPSARQALKWTQEYDVPLHPAYTYLWHDISVEDFTTLADAVARGHVVESDGAMETRPAELTIVIPREEGLTDILEALLIEHTQGSDSVTIPDALPFVRSLGVTPDLEREWDTLPAELESEASAVPAVNAVAPFTVRERAPIRIGSRMGRPEKSESRELSPAVHTLFPLGEAGGDQRDVAAAAQNVSDDGPRGQVTVEVARRRCPACEDQTYRPACPSCGHHTVPEYRCPDCDELVRVTDTQRDTCGRCGTEPTAVETRALEVGDAYRDALAAVGERETAFEMLKGVKGLTSAEKTPEPIEKGILRAKHDVSVFKDGTIRYDMTDLPVTSVRPSELNVSVEQFRELGYEEDIHGDPLRYDDQLVSLRVQDVVLSEGAADHLLDVADFIDDLLEQFYGLESFYDVSEQEDLVGELVFGLAPHTSAAVVGRIVGFTSAAVGYAHPYFHAAKRRNCFHPDTNLWYGDASGDWHYGSIADLVEARLDPATAETDAVGALVQDLDATVQVPSVTQHGEPTRKPIETISKHPAPDHLIELETASGATIQVTPDHTMLRWTDHLEELPASRITSGDRVPAYDGGETTTMTSHDVAADGQPALPFEEIVRTDIIETDVEYTYCVTVADTNTIATEGLYVGQCDGDEDCVLLLMDGLLNFSSNFLPSSRGGRMDAPLVMSSHVDPREIDDEAHNLDDIDQYPLEFYEATREMADPTAIDIPLAGDSLDDPDQSTAFAHTHDTSDLALGPALSAYKTLGSMDDKLDAQLALARRLRGVDETDVAERIIESHFLPDLIGNLRAFSRQETRCLGCGTKYRRPPLTGDCRECGGTVNLTVHEGSVNKYMDTARRIAEEFGTREYTRQRIDILERSLESIFEDDTNKQSGIADFM